MEYFFTIIIWGSLWGIFEASIGYLIHLMPVRIGWLIWYPIACFFMGNVYRKTKSLHSVFLISLLSSSIKMLNLFTPIRVDKVINPAVSIIFEAISLTFIIYINKEYFYKINKIIRNFIISLLMNTGWRLIYLVYLSFLVPKWMKDISVLSSYNKFIEFFLIHNFLSTIIIFLGLQCKSYLLYPILKLEELMDKSTLKNKLINNAYFIVFCSLAMLAINIFLQFSL